mmetsp:Transcript_27225/g.86508  ORF Transcript_27225/g.86508 Transcript_27225/m.86508 type:complete len:216 (+) Transcript_27225:772-1419(+)
MCAGGWPGRAAVLPERTALRSADATRLGPDAGARRHAGPGAGLYNSGQRGLAAAGATGGDDTGDLGDGSSGRGLVARADGPGDDDHLSASGDHDLPDCGHPAPGPAERHTAGADVWGRGCDVDDPGTGLAGCRRAGILGCRERAGAGADRDDHGQPDDGRKHGPCHNIGPGIHHHCRPAAGRAEALRGVCCPPWGLHSPAGSASHHPRCFCASAG